MTYRAYYKLALLLLFVSPILFLPFKAKADVIWPAVYVADSHSHFWYVVMLGLLIEAGVFRWRLIPSVKKALIISLVSNAISATIGIYLLMFGMIGWHLVADNFVRGTFADFNKIATIIIMLCGSTFIEMLVARGIWKYKFSILSTRENLIISLRYNGIINQFDKN